MASVLLDEVEKQPAQAGVLALVRRRRDGLVAWVVFGEQLPLVQIAGGAVVVGGIVRAETARTPAVVEVPAT